jgi:hypothetical protein
MTPNILRAFGLDKSEFSGFISLRAIYLSCKLSDVELPEMCPELNGLEILLFCSEGFRENLPDKFCIRMKVLDKLRNLVKYSKNLKHLLTNVVRFFDAGQFGIHIFTQG